MRDPDIQRLIAHGYGRTLYFKDLNVGLAIRSAARLVRAGHARLEGVRVALEGPALGSLPAVHQQVLLLCLLVITAVAAEVEDHDIVGLWL